MGYIRAFRNTLVVDVLEFVGLVKVPHEFREQGPPAKETESSTFAEPAPGEPPHTLVVNVLKLVGLVKVPQLQKQKPPAEETEPSTTAKPTQREYQQDEEKEAQVVAGDTTESTQREYPLDEEMEAQAIGENTPEFVVQEPKPVGDPFLVDWNGPNDPENPLNWPGWKKQLVVKEMMLYTAVSYIGSSIYTPGQQGIEETFHVGHVASALPLSIFVLGYGIGPLIFSPLSEVAAIGRSYVYMSTLLLFVLFQIGCALSPSYGGLVVLRLIAGILSSPSISTGGATMGDIITPDVLPYYIALWAVGAVGAPVLAPLLGASMVDTYSWRWIFWFLFFLSGSCVIIFSLLFPETYGPNVLHRRGNRIRSETGDKRYYTLQEREDSKIKPGAFFIDTLWRPLAMMVVEPGVMAFDMYTALCYGCLYLFFESFPIVFVEMYHFTLVETGLAYMGFEVGCVICWFVMAYFLKTRIIPRFVNGTFVPEDYLILSMWVCFLLPLSLLLFGWTAQVHWILPIIWEIPFVIAVFNIFHSCFGYFAMSYPRYLASVFAGNALLRSCFAAAFPLFGRAMYDNLSTKRFPVGWGSTLLAFLTLAMCVIPFVMYRYGRALRGRSKYAN